MADTITPGNPKGGYDSKRFRAWVQEARKQGATDAEIADELKDHPVLGPKIAAGKDPTSAINAAAFIYDDKYDPTEGMSGTEKFLAGAGRATANAMRGAKQFFGSPFVDQATRESWGAEQAEANKLDRPLTDTGAGFAGELVGDLALGAAAGGPVGGLAAKMIPTVGRAAGAWNLTKRAGRAGAIGVPSSVAGGALAPTEGTLSSFEDYAKKSGTDVAMGAVGDVGARAAGRMIKPLRFDVDPTLKARIDYLQQRGVGNATPMNNQQGAFDLAQLTGDPTLRDLKESLSKLPGFASSAEQRRVAQLADFTQSATSHAGKPVRNVSSDTLGDLKEGMFARRNEFTNGPDVPLDPAFLSAVARGRADLAAQASVVGMAKPATMSPFDSALAASRGGQTVIPAKDALLARSVLGDTQHRGMKETATPLDAFRGQAAASVKDAYDDAISRAFNQQSPGMGNALDAWRKQDSVLMDIEAAAGRAGGLLDADTLNPKALAQVVRGRAGARNMATGENELGKLAAETGRILDPKTPNSGTTQRSLYSALLLGGPAALTHMAGNGGTGSALARMLMGPAFGEHMLHGKGVFGKKHMLNGLFGPNASDPIIESLLRNMPGAAANALSEE